MYKVIIGLNIYNFHNLDGVSELIVKSEKPVKIIYNNIVLSENDIEKLILNETKSFNKMLKIFNQHKIKIVL